MRKPLLAFAAVVAVIAVVVALSNVNPTVPASPGPGASAAGGPSPAPAPIAMWPAPPDPMARTIAAGLEPAPKEYLTNHVHAHLDVFVDGQPVLIPAGIGIDITNPEVKTFQNPTAYGGIEMCDQACISPLHTHDESGILHTESADARNHTLGEFFTEWGLDFSASCVADLCSSPIAVYVDGALQSGDPAAIELIDRRVIVVVVGTPPATIPSTADFSNA